MNAPLHPLRALAVVLALAVPAAAQEPPTLDWYLPDDVEYADDVPRPSAVLGWEVGTWHVRHDQLVRYFEELAEASPRMQVREYARSHEERPLLLAAVSSPANLARLDALRDAHREAVLGGADAAAGPTVVWMGYSVHGDEPSGSNAALLFAYHLAAARGEALERFLEQTVVLIDPSLNPDGLSRFAQWANMHKGANLVGDPDHREHRQGWPSGRTNHYWFDLNRDWLLGVHPESQGRLAEFHAWMPVVLTDFHEMGSDSTFFFQPGIPSRQNPLTPAENLELTRAIATHHAAALDELGSLYYTEESFDDFYYGKGSTYPDLHGAVGILFEQASARGHLQENSFGGVSFPFAIRNQLTASLSTLAAVEALRDELGAYQRGFYRSALEEAARHPVAGYVLGAPEDAARTAELVTLLRRHGVRVHALGTRLEPTADDPQAYAPGEAYVVPVEQPQFRLVRALFETRTSWDDNTFYDVSTWTLPLTFGVPARAVARDAWSPALVGDEVDASARPAGRLTDADAPVAWAFDWHDGAAPRALGDLLASGVRARVATKRLTAATTDGQHAFDYGAVVVPAGIQDVPADELRRLLAEVAAAGVDVHALTSGLTPSGVDLGSNSLAALQAPAPLLLVGDGVSSYQAGEVWHHLDLRLDLPVTLAERDRLGRLDLDRYTHLLLVDGATSGWRDDDLERVRDWTRDGGVVVALGDAAVWAAEELLGTADEEDEREDEGSEADDEADDERPTYEDYDDLSAVHRIAGTIFEVELDRTHPLAFGYVRERLPVFKRSTALLPDGDDPFATPLRYVDGPQLSGYASAENVERIAGTPAARVGRVGAGTVVCLLDDPVFRGIWRGTDRLLTNALFFGGAVKRTGPVDPPR